MSDRQVNNASWAAALLGLCYRAGVRHFFVAPGSRSAALALAAAQLRRQYSDVYLHTHFDERGLSFYALGVARVLGAPVVLIVTSGTAVANLHPAVIEAYEVDLPLWVFSADRPDRLLGCGANQAIDQKCLFGSHVHFNISISVPASDAGLRAQLDTLASGFSAGPAHINCQFDEPLYEGTPIDYMFAGRDISWISVPKPAAVSSWCCEAPKIEFALNTVVVLGALTPDDARQIEPWVSQLRCPVIADIGSQYRFLSHDGFINNADLFLLNERGRQLLNADQVIQLGGRIVSKRINQWLSDFKGPYWLLSDQRRGLDPTHTARQCALDLNNLPQVRAWSDGILTELRQASQRLENATKKLLKDQWSEASVCAAVSACLPPGTVVFAGNSLSIRMLDSFGLSGNGGCQWYTNRGASGIDGLLATAAGVCWGAVERVVLVVGDTAFLHDMNSLALLARLPKPLKIVLLNNAGGRIFGLLPAAETSVFDELFVMPHRWDFEGACRQFQIDYSRVESRAQFDEKWEAWVSGQGASVVECSLPETMDTLRRNYSILENCI